jgi:hypothetical protein
VCNNFKLLFFPFFGSLVDKSQKKIFSQWLLILREETPPRLGFFCLTNKDIQSIEIKRCLHSPPNLLASKSSPRPRRRRNRSTKLSRCVCLIVNTYTSMRFLALCSFSLKGFFVRAFWKVNSLSRMLDHFTTRERNPHTRALKSTDYLLTTRLSSSHIIHR